MDAKQKIIELLINQLPETNEPENNLRAVFTRVINLTTPSRSAELEAVLLEANGIISEIITNSLAAKKELQKRTALVTNEATDDANLNRIHPLNLDYELNFRTVSAAIEAAASA